MGQRFSKRPFCLVKGIWMNAGFWEYTIPIQSLPGTTVESLVHKFKEQDYNHYITNHTNNQKILTVYIPEENILLDIFHSLKIPFDIHALVKPSMDK